jgi:hypothetical protein
VIGPEEIEDVAQQLREHFEEELGHLESLELPVDDAGCLTFDLFYAWWCRRQEERQPHGTTPTPHAPVRSFPLSLSLFLSLLLSVPFAL